MVFFVNWNVTWSATSAYLQHSYINWMTRGLHAGYRRVHFNTQIDDVHLVTEVYEPKGGKYRINPTDLGLHADWTDDINSRLPAGSSYIIELAHNGNGNLEYATKAGETKFANPCSGASLIDTGTITEDSSQTYNFVKPPGTGTDHWPADAQTFNASQQCLTLDPFLTWLTNADNRNRFAHVSHTYTHLELNNATYSDANKEIKFNREWLGVTGISLAPKFSPQGIVPPAITGLLNSDVIKAWLDNGIRYVVGDNTRPTLRNKQRFWPLDSMPGTNASEGVTIVPRWATEVYYNCDTIQCDLNEWSSRFPTNTPTKVVADLLGTATFGGARNLLALQHDPFMFHQANLRTDVDDITINGKTGQYSLLMAFTEAVLQEMGRLTDWPIITKTHDDLARSFIDRRTRDQCGYKLTYVYGSDSSTITGVEVSSTDNTCSVPIPVTFPGAVADAGDETVEQVRLFYVQFPGKSS